MSWLSGWGKRIELTVDHTRVNEDLTDFPLLITLSSGVGITNSDNRCVINELPPVIPEVSRIGLIHEYTMDTISGSILKDTVTTSSIDGTINNSTVVSGVVGNALNFGLIDSTIRNVTLASSISGFQSISFWMRRHDINAYDNMFVNSAGSHFAACQINSSSNYLYTYVGGQNNTNLSISDTNWHHVVCVVEAGALRFYLDKVPASSTVPWGTDIKYIGRPSTAVGQEVPAIDQMRFYDEALSEDRIDELYEEGIPKYTKKLLVTTENNAPCYTEIEYWDAFNKKAHLWTKVPTISSGVDTKLYIYYDKTHADCSATGSTGDFAAQNVWDDDFICVYHMGQNPNADYTNAIKDSTKNTINGTPAGSMTSTDLVDGKISKAIDFDTNDKIVSPNNSAFNFSGEITVSAWIYPRSVTGGHHAIASKGGGWSTAGYFLDVGYINNSLRWHLSDNGSEQYLDSSAVIANNTWQHVAGLWKNNTLYIYINGDQDTPTSSWSLGYVYNASFTSDIGHRNNYYFNGMIDEVRVSKIARSSGWLKTSYYSYIDDLIVWGTEELEPIYYIDGYVKEKGVAASRTVRIYDRNSGSLRGYTISNSSTGYYYVTTTVSGEHFVVAFDDDVGDVYNALISDRLTPRVI